MTLFFMISALLSVLILVGIIAAIKGIGSVIKEKKAVKEHFKALADNRFLPADRKIHFDSNFFVFRLKIVLFTIAVILTVIFMVALPLYSAETSKTFIITAFAALAAGIIGALFFSGFITGPFLKMNGDIIQMLEKKFEETFDITEGMEIQKMFLPLDSNKNGNKLSSGYKDTDNAVFFGYYEGAHKISGDYFDYKDIDGRHYAIIMCDVAGKGIPAALIMVQVATMFHNFFNKWKPDTEKNQIEDFVYQTNGFIEALKFKDRFAAFSLCIFDTQTGELRFCNAGNNIICIFDSFEKSVKYVTLPETPAAGILTNEMVESKGGYKVQTLFLNRGDFMLLYTDGIEDSKRKFRNNFYGFEREVFGSERVYQIINAVMNRDVFNLRKRDKTEIHLLFDFSSGQCGIDEVVLALVGIEKMFRCYRDSAAGVDARVTVDKKTDAFLKKHFLQYKNYCAGACEYPENDGYVCYTNLREDNQYDDLAILGIKRK